MLLWATFNIVPQDMQYYWKSILLIWGRIWLALLTVVAYYKMVGRPLMPDNHISRPPYSAAPYTYAFSLFLIGRIWITITKPSINKNVLEELQK